jgi:NAD(P)-dependent dehydrogenase (short-subunit alcohol dehydrogenase family)
LEVGSWKLEVGSSKVEVAMEIRERVFLVSGGSSGLGAGCVRLLAHSGAKVLVADINQEAGERLASELGSAVGFIKTDVTDEKSVQAALDLAHETWGGLHGAICCAGVATAEKVLGKAVASDKVRNLKPHSLHGFQRVIAVNLVGTFNVFRLAAAVIAQDAPAPTGERGVLIATASVAAFEGQIGQVAYAASKGGIVSMVLPMARELARHGIRVLAIAPGIFDTPLLAGLPEPARISLGQQVPFPPRLGKPEEFAALACHMIENEMLNGCVIRLDGALRMGPK